MALGRNHKIFNIGNASGTIQGLTRVYHDLTLSGDGTLSSLLGVVGDKADEEVNQYVYDNSATIDNVNTSYQTNSGTFLTAIPDYYATTGDINDLAQSISETYQVKGDYLVRSDSANFYPSNNPSGFITGVDLSNFYTKDETSGKEELAQAFADIPVGDPEVNAYVTNNSASLNRTTDLVQSNSSVWNDITVYQSNSSNYLTAVDLTPYQTTADMINYAKASALDNITNDFDSLSSNINSNSGVWNDVVNKLYISSYHELSAGTNIDIQNYVISSKDWNNEIEQASANAFNEATAQIPPQFDPTYISGVIDNKLNTTAFSDVSGSFLTAVSIPESADWSETTDVVQNNSGKWNDITAYQNASAGYLTAHQSLDGYATENWVTAQGYITGVNISESATWNETSTTVQTNSSNWDNVTNKLDTTAFSNVSGNFLTAHQDLSNYYTKSETSGADELANAFANIPADDSEVNSYVHNNSATINEVNSTVQSNSATWAQGASTSGFVSGTNVVKKPDYEGSTDGRYWSACISGDVKVFTGYYANDSYISGGVYSLSSIGNDLNNKLDKNTIEHSNTLRIINNNPYEVFDIAYKRTNFTNGSARRISLYDDYADINFYAGEVVEGSNLYSASITAETTATGREFQSEVSDVWKIVDFSNGSAILTAIYPVGIQSDSVLLTTYQGWGPITNCEATCTVYTSAELAQLAFKDDIPSGGGGVPQSAFDELKQSYDILSASYATLSSLFATYSGQWLLPNEGV